MNHIPFFTALILLVHQFVACMDPVVKNKSYFRFTTEQPRQEFIIPLDVAKQCENIKNMFEDISEQLPSEMPSLSLEDNCAASASEFVNYLQNIYDINQLPKPENGLENDEQLLSNILNRRIQTLSSPQLTNLFITIDTFNVIERNNNHLISNEVARRIIENPEQEKSFYQLNNRALFRNVVKNINTTINFEQKHIQLYANTLTQRQGLKRTVSPLIAAWYNTTNTLTAPIRWVASPSWAIKTIMRPYYLNNQTETMITGFVQKHDPKDKVTQLLITNKKTNRNQIISLDGKNIATIKQIEANAAETVFICRTTDNKIVIINTLTENHIVDNDFADCVFSKNDNKLYAIKEKEFGVFDIENTKFESIEQLTDDAIYTDIKINKNKTNLILCHSCKDGIDEYGMDKFIDEVWIWKQCSDNQSSFKQNISKVFGVASIHNICLHPTEDMLCIQYYCFKGSTLLKTACIDINTEKVIYVDNSIPLGDIFQFIGDSDILFIGTPPPKKAVIPALQAPLQDDYFVNIKNGHLWSKEKNKSDERILGAKKTETDITHYERIALTADCMQAIEQKAEGHALLDFCSIILAAGKGPADWSINRIAAVPLADDTIIKTIKNLNAGFISPETIAHMSQKVKDQSAQKAGQTAQAMRTAINIILGLGAIFLSFKLKCWELDKKNNPQEYANAMDKNYHGHDIAKIVTSCIFGTFLLFFLNQIAAQY